MIETEPKKISRREFIKYSVLAIGCAVALFSLEEINKLFKKGITVSHIVSAAKRYSENPVKMTEYIPRNARGIVMGELAPDFEQITIDTQDSKYLGVAVAEFVIEKLLQVDPAPKAEMREDHKATGAVVRIEKNKIRQAIKSDIPCGDVAIAISKDIYGAGEDKENGGIIILDDNAISVVTNVKQSVNKRSLIQQPYTFSFGDSRENLPEEIRSDTYIWVFVVDNGEFLYFQTINFGVRISLDNQRKLLSHIVSSTWHDTISDNSPVTLTAKGSGSAFSVGKKVYGPPFEVRREEIITYLNLFFKK